MTVLLLWKEHLKEFYNKYSYWIRFVVRLLLVLCTVLSMNANIGYMTKLKNPAVVLLLCVFGALLPDSASVFLMGCVMVAHVYAVSMEMALITLMMILVVAVLYYGFKPGDSWLMVLPPLAFPLFDRRHPLHDAVPGAGRERTLLDQLRQFDGAFVRVPDAE